ncbi:hypothetical protein C0993_011232 [Termitomyces sp. T159_Od127]|nr:hypothetical protein C0993_011232 [Termitomyces sp. T159_Od127]
MMLFRIFSLFLCLATFVNALYMPLIRPLADITHRAVEVLTSPLPAIVTEVSTTTNVEHITTEVKASDSLPSFPIEVEVTTTKTATTRAPTNTPSFLVGTQTGNGTYSTGLGACGIVNHDSDHIVAVSHFLFDAFPGYNGINPTTNPVCGKQISVSYQGKSVIVTVADCCEGCALTDLDFSPAAFDILADPSVGRLDGITWHWMD